MYTTTTRMDSTDDLREIARTERIRRPQVAKHQPRVRDGIKHPVTVRLVAAKVEGTEPA